MALKQPFGVGMTGQINATGGIDLTGPLPDGLALSDTPTGDGNTIVASIVRTTPSVKVAFWRAAWDETAGTLTKVTDLQVTPGAFAQGEQVEVYSSIYPGLLALFASASDAHPSILSDANAGGPGLAGLLFGDGTSAPSLPLYRTSGGSLGIGGASLVTPFGTLDAAAYNAWNAAAGWGDHAGLYVLIGEIGAANGVAELDSGGKVPAAQLPSYVDDVLEYADLASFPPTGEAGKIYVALDTLKTYRWGGSSYAEISESLALGETSTTAYRGDRGKAAYDHSQATGNPHGTTTVSYTHLRAHET